ncbi:flagellar basal body P-ring formation chaperone FlgA [Sulfurimonas sp. C5]|uniref:flagellar basal body P-ring formation chaperone FlgA n=1 Tax=Sulfurimonas sp. C5 TaxID=3036947 RepID=UPI0024567551|nr:flagellar basal body P-ring formation chaperone FlgA [Sulfurimonas sp. C5]MDH4943981.1 flagellar basal body P-ring formation chaperone FlgA [Sulfurimonas sp. C5]
MIKNFTRIILLKLIMYVKTILLLLLFTIQVWAVELQRNYFVHGDTIRLSTVIPNIPSKKDILLFTLSEKEHIFRIKASDLIKILQNNGFKEYTSPYSYIQFNKISPIDTSKIESFIKDHYRSKYQNIEIKKITVFPRYYMDAMPKHYTIKIRSREHLSDEGIVSITTDENKKIFFNYEIKASIQVYLLKNSLERNGELSVTNTLKHSIILDKFRAMPVQTIENGTLELKHTMKKGELLTLRDVESLALIRRNSSVNVTLQNDSIVISFSARALQDGRKGDIIFVENEKGKKIKVVVVGKNKAKVK